MSDIESKLDAIRRNIKNRIERSARTMEEPQDAFDMGLLYREIDDYLAHVFADVLKTIEKESGGGNERN